MTITLKIIKTIIPGVALGQDNDGNTFHVNNGDIYADQYCEVNIIGDIAIPKVFDYNISYFIKKIW